MSGDSYTGAQSVLENRRLAARAKYLSKLDDIYEKLPQVKQITDDINRLGASRTLAVLAKNVEESKKIRSQMDSLAQQRSDILKENGYSDSDLEMQYYCSKCHDTGFVNGKVCRCMKDEMLKQRQRFLTALSPVPKADFASFNIDYYSKEPRQISNGAQIVPYDHMKQIYDYCFSYAEHFSLSNKSLLMLGSAGLGKTHLACSIAAACIEKGFTVMYSSSQSLFAQIEQARYTDEDILSDILSCDLFILDDLGAENLTSYCTGVLYNIVNTRMIKNLPCIYTTNIVSQNALQKRYGEKITSRLMGSCSILSFIGDDIRILKNR